MSWTVVTFAMAVFLALAACAKATSTPSPAPTPVPVVDAYGNRVPYGGALDVLYAASEQAMSDAAWGQLLVWPCTAGGQVGRVVLHRPPPTSRRTWCRT